MSPSLNFCLIYTDTTLMHWREFTFLWGILWVVGTDALGQALLAPPDQKSIDRNPSIIPGALLRPLIFEPASPKLRPTPLIVPQSFDRPLQAKVLVVRLIPAKNLERVRTQRKSHELSIKTHLAPLRWVQPADGFAGLVLVHEGN